MKTAIYIEDGIMQLVLTPENDFEKDALSSFNDKETTSEIFSGSFYDCRGGWIRQNSYHSPMHGMGLSARDANDQSLILKTVTKENSHAD